MMTLQEALARVDRERKEMLPGKQSAMVKIVECIEAGVEPNEMAAWCMHLATTLAAGGRFAGAAQAVDMAKDFSETGKLLELLMEVDQERGEQMLGEFKDHMRANIERLRRIVGTQDAAREADMAITKAAGKGGAE